MFFFTPQKTTAGFRSAGRSRIYSRNKPQIKQMECFDTSVPRRQSSFRSRRADFALPTLFFSAFLVTRHHCHKLGEQAKLLPSSASPTSSTRGGVPIALLPRRERRRKRATFSDSTTRVFVPTAALRQTFFFNFCLYTIAPPPFCFFSFLRYKYAQTRWLLTWTRSWRCCRRRSALI